MSAKRNPRITLIRTARKMRQRRGATLVTAALVLPIFFMFLFGTIVGAVGVFRYQEVAMLAREATRYASVHGTKYAQVTGNPAATSTDVYNNAILPKVNVLDTTQLNYQVTWTPDNQPGSTVSVTITYNWIPELYFPITTLKSTSVMTMAY